MGEVFSSGEDNRRTGDAFMVTRRVRFGESGELADDGVHIGVFIPLPEKVGEEMRRRSCAKCRAEILKGIFPAIIDSASLVFIYPPFREFL